MNSLEPGSNCWTRNWVHPAGEAAGWKQQKGWPWQIFLFSAQETFGKGFEESRKRGSTGRDANLLSSLPFPKALPSRIVQASPSDCKAQAWQLQLLLLLGVSLSPLQEKIPGRLDFNFILTPCYSHRSLGSFSCWCPQVELLAGPFTSLSCTPWLHQS